MRTRPGVSGTNSSFSPLSVLKIFKAILRTFYLTDRLIFCKLISLTHLAKAGKKA